MVGRILTVPITILSSMVFMALPRYYNGIMFKT